jgi:hypothetical protein
MIFASLRRRLPPLREIGETGAICILTVQAWEFYNIFREIPALRFRETTWDMIGIVSIVQVFALFESLLVLLLLTTLATILPQGWYRQRFVALSTVWLLASAAAAIFIHLDGEPMTVWPAQKLSVWLSVYLLSGLTTSLFVFRLPRLEKGIHKTVQKVTLLAQVYVAISLLGLAVILIRNI